MINHAFLIRGFHQTVLRHLWRLWTSDCLNPQVISIHVYLFLSNTPLYYFSGWGRSPTGLQDPWPLLGRHLRLRRWRGQEDLVLRSRHQRTQSIDGRHKGSAVFERDQGLRCRWLPVGYQRGNLFSLTNLTDLCIIQNFSNFNYVPSSRNPFYSLSHF